MAADIYLPIEFDGRLKVGDYRVASAHGLSDILEELKEELAVEEADEDEEDEDSDGLADEGTVIEAQLRNIWRLTTDAAGVAVEKRVPLHLRS
jgi:hypothetical protein